MARVFLTIFVLAVSWAGAEQAKPTGGSPPAVTLRTLIVGTFQEVQRYAESVVGSGVIRSGAEVQTGGPPVNSLLFLSLLFDSYFLNILFYWVFGLTSLFDLSLFLLNN